MPHDITPDPIGPTESTLMLTLLAQGFGKYMPQ